MQEITQPWLVLFGETDLAVMFGIAVIAYMLRVSKIERSIAIAAPTVLGGLFGLLLALETTDVLGFGSYILRGVIINGAAATLLARLLHTLLARVWKAAGASNGQ